MGVSDPSYLASGGTRLVGRSAEQALIASRLDDPQGGAAVAMAALDLLVDAAAEQPLLVAAEDLQWLDPATVRVLRFIGRRLADDPIVLLATARDDEPDALGDAATSCSICSRSVPATRVGSSPLQAAFAARVERLPPAARTALILLALHDSESLAEVVVHGTAGQ